MRIRLTVVHSPVCRLRNHSVSSGTFAYQISMYWEKAMYAQKTTNPKSSLPKSW